MPGTAGAGIGDKPRNGPDFKALPHPATDTQCARCHTTAGWREVSFAHERTGFPLRGAHARIDCRACHQDSFTRALGRTCTSCHRDEHEGRLGTRCASCHEETTWKATFDADAHRRGNFPLTGRHAFLACEECHGDRRDQGFARTTPACLGCHQKDWDRTRGSAVDHVTAGFSTACQTCHQPWRFKGASFPQHDVCFRLSSGPHAGISCTSCHTAIPALSALGAGTCSTGTAACTRCHDCGRHPQSVPGFACVERKCYECHQFAQGAAAAGKALLRRSR